jgi:hypothetical protein
VRVRGDMKIVSRTEEKVRRTASLSVKETREKDSPEGAPHKYMFWQG